MNVERVRTLLLSLPHVVETMQWGDNLVFWAGDKAVGGKMFALVALDADTRSHQPVLSFLAGPATFADLLELEGCIPAPYFARIYWIAVTGWSVFSPGEWDDHLRRAHTLTLEKLTPKTRGVLALPPAEQARAIAARRKELADRSAATGAKPKKR